MNDKKKLEAGSGESIMDIIEYSDKTYTRQPTILLSNYRKQWNMWDVLRELESNSHDETNCWIKLTGDENKTIVSDKGNGLTLGQLIYLGANENKSSDKIGKFGEGLKVSMAVTLRLGYKVSIRSKNYFVKVDLEDALFKTEDNAKAVVFFIAEGLDEIKGTEITIHGLPLSEAEALIDNKFLVDFEDSIICEGGTTQILSGKYKGKLFSKGVYVQDLVNANYGYNINNLKLNTDRQASDMNETLKYIAYDLDRFESKELAKQYLLNLINNINCLERQATNVYLNQTVKEAWAELNLGLVTDNSNMIGELRHYGKEALVLNTTWCNSMEGIGIVTGRKFLQLQAEASRRAKRKTYHQLSLDKREALDSAIEIIDAVPLFDTKISEQIECLRFYEPSPEIDNSGYYDPIDLTVNLRNEEATFKTNRLAQIITHEFIHKFEGYRDATAEFQHSLDSKIEKLFAYLLDKSKNLALFNQKLIDNNGQLTVTVPPKFNKKLNTNSYYKVKVQEIYADIDLSKTKSNRPKTLSDLFG